MGKVQVRMFLFRQFVLSIFLLVRTGEAQSKSRSFLINCGANFSVNVNGRKWIGDLASSGNTFTISNNPGITASIATLADDSIYEPLYNTARIFTSSLNYTFRGIAGNHFVRLHFCPFFPVGDYNVDNSSFTVSANGLRLVSEFNVSGEILHKNLQLQGSESNSSSFSLIKEYIIAIDRDVLVIEFFPSKGSFGFINAIEIVPVMKELFADKVNKVGGNSVNLNLSRRGIETMYRLNVSGPEIQPDQDKELWRIWGVDYNYMITADAGSAISNRSNITYASMNDSIIAPLLVYETARTTSETEVLQRRFNMSWKFEVDPDFDYLIRLHFCEMFFDNENQRTFRIYINNRTAADNFDIFVHAGGMNKAYHEDFLDVLSSKINTLWIQLGPDVGTGATGTDALLNGLEIFKLSQNGNLAYIERYNSFKDLVGSPEKARILRVGIGAGFASIAILGIIIALIFYFCKVRRRKTSDTKGISPRLQTLSVDAANVSSIAAGGSRGIQNPNGSILSNRVGKRFTIAEIRAATKNFDENLVIGEGGFGKVYKGEIEDGMLAAIKRANPQSEQGLAEFETEIEMLSKLRHRHLVSMIGYCDEQNEMVLVYEYMEKGTLRNHLFGSNLSPLTWKQRLEVCIGAARGLYYLHTGAERRIIHRDVKTTNILLDENLVPKVSDFGLSKTGPAWDHTHVSTAVKGSFGYLDPEYFRRQRLTERSDVYSFGVVLWEVVCARAVINPSLPKDQINLAEWAMTWQRQRSLETIIDPHLKANYCPESLKKFGEIAEKCLADEGKNRPTMGEVLWHLEYALQLQEAWIRTHDEQNRFSSCRALGSLEEGQAREGKQNSS